MKKDETITYYPVCDNGYIKHIQTAHTCGEMTKKQLIKNLKKWGNILIVDRLKNYEPDCGKLCGTYLKKGNYEQ